MHNTGYWLLAIQQIKLWLMTPNIRKVHTLGHPSFKEKQEYTRTANQSYPQLKKTCLLKLKNDQLTLHTFSTFFVP